MSIDEQFESLRLKLEKELQWPNNYMFKFIISKENTEAKGSLLLLFGANTQISQKDSSTGKYTSLTIISKQESPESVIEIYKNAAGIAGVMAL